MLRQLIVIRCRVAIQTLTDGPEIGGTDNPLCLIPDPVKSGDQDCQQYCNNSNYYEQFDQGKGFVPVFHFRFPFPE